MGLWQKIGRVFAGGAVDATWLEAVQRQLVEADFGVAATNEMVERLSRAPTGDAARARPAAAHRHADLWRQWNGEDHVGRKACQAAARGRAERVIGGRG